MKKEVSIARTTEPMKQCMIKKCGWEEKTFLAIEWDAHRRAVNRHHKQRTELNKHLGNILRVGKVVSRCDPVKHRSDCPACGTAVESPASLLASTCSCVGRGNCSQAVFSDTLPSASVPDQVLWKICLS